MVLVGRVPADPATLIKIKLHAAINDALDTAGALPSLVGLV